MRNVLLGLLFWIGPLVLGMGLGKLTGIDWLIPAPYFCLLAWWFYDEVIKGNRSGAVYAKHDFEDGGE